MNKAYKYLALITLFLFSLNSKAAWSNIYFWNGTPFTLKLGETKQELGPQSPQKLIEGAHYEVHEKEIKPWTRGLILKFKRDKLPKLPGKKTTFTFSTEAYLVDEKNNKIFDHPLKIVHFLTTPRKGTLLPPSQFKEEVLLGDVRFDKSKKVHKLQHIPSGREIITYKFDGKYDNIDYKNQHIDLYFDSYLRGLFHDHEYALALRKHSGAKIDNNKNVLRVLNWNIWSLPVLIAPFDGQLARAKTIPKSIYGMFTDYLPDVVVFNEVFEPLLLKSVLGKGGDLKNGMKELGYQYHTKVVGKNKIGKIIPKKKIKLSSLEFDEAKETWHFSDETIQEAIESGFTIKPHLRTSNGGVVIFSLWPILESKEFVFDVYSGKDGFAAKGVAYAKINKNGKIYNIFGTHLNAGSFKPTQMAKLESMSIRKKQLIDMNNFIKEQKIPKNEPIIISGDLNIPKYYNVWKGDTLESQYKAMLKRLNATHPEHGLKWTTPKYKFLDYVLYVNDHKKPVKSFNKPLGYGIYLQEPWIKWKKGRIKNLFKKNKHIRFRASDHYPILGYFEFQ